MATVVTTTLLGTPHAARAQAPLAMTLAVDATEAPRGLIHLRETIPVNAGALTLDYPRWLPGEHAPNGPIPNLATLAIDANGTKLAWTRDLVDLDSFHVDVPSGVQSLTVTYDYLGADNSKYSAARLSTPNLLALTWNKVSLTPRAADYANIIVTPTITLPAGWQFATALETATASGASTTFKPVTFEQLIDSPLDAGVNVKKIALGEFDGVPVELDAFADTPSQLAIKAATVTKYRNLVAEMHALYGVRHFNHYNFLLTVSDVMPGEGLEHHQSSDNGVDGDFFTDAAALTSDADLLPHEFNHSWNGKYRRPFDLATRNLHDPQRDDLLWVYEGMTQHYGLLQAERSNLLTKAQWLDALAGIYANLDTTTGRKTTTLGDTATDSSNLYTASGAFSSMRRSVDYYDESALMWLEADTIIRAKTGGKKSLDDAARLFYGVGGDTGPKVVPYTRADVIAALAATAPYDWAGFFVTHVDKIALHPPDPFTAGGYTLAYTATPSGYEKIVNGVRKRLDLRYSLGIAGKTDGTVVDIIDGMPAARAGMRPGDKITGVNGRMLESGSQSQLDAALKAAMNGSGLRLLVSGGNTYHEYTFDVRTGPRYPHLERSAGRPDVLSLVAAPKRPNAAPEKPPAKSEDE